MSWFFDGADDVATGPATFSPGNTVTYFAWINPTSFGEVANARIFYLGTTFSAPFRSSLAISNTQVNTSSLVWNVGATVQGSWVAPTNTIVLATYQSVAVTFDFGSLSNVPVMYKNGVDVGTVTTVTSPTVAFTADNHPMYIGNVPDGSRTFDGLIAHSAIWSRILTPDEIQDVHRRGPFARPKGLILYYPGNGPTITPYDFSGTGNAIVSFTGTVINASEPNIAGALLIR